MATTSRALGPWTASSLGLYAVGVAVSQSLMSLGGTLVCILLALVLVKNPKQILDKSNRSLLIAMAYVVWVAVQLITSPNPYFESRAWSHLPLYLIPFFALFVSLEGQLERRWKLVLHMWLAAFTASCCFAIYQGVFLQQMATGWLRNPIFFAYNVLFQVVCFATLFKYSVDHLNADQRRTGRLLLAAIFLGLVAIFLSNSRMVMLCSAVILTGMLLPTLWKKGRQLIPGGRASLLVGALILGGTVLYEYKSKAYVRDRVHNALNFSSPSWKGRMRAWEHNKELIAQNPISGVGLLQNGLYTKDLEKRWQKLWGPDVVIYAHNVYLQLLAESGVIGLCLLLCALVMFCRRYPSSVWLLVTLALSGLTENALSNSKSLHSFLFCLLFVGLSSNIRSKFGYELGDAPQKG